MMMDLRTCSVVDLLATSQHMAMAEGRAVRGIFGVCGAVFAPVLINDQLMSQS